MSEAMAQDRTPEERRAARMLLVSGRRLMCLGDAWGVVARGDRRTRPLARLDDEAVQRMVAGGVVVRAAGGGFVLAAGPGGEAVADAGPGVFVAAGLPRSRRSGAGFQGLALRAVAGDGPLSSRQARAGLRLVADAEASVRTRGLTMDWSATPSDRGRRSGRAGGLGDGARAAARRIAALRVSMGDAVMDVAWAACVEGQPLSMLERRFGLPRRSGARRLAQALDALADGYDG